MKLRFAIALLFLVSLAQAEGEAHKSPHSTLAGTVRNSVVRQATASSQGVYSFDLGAKNETYRPHPHALNRANPQRRDANLYLIDCWQQAFVGCRLRYVHGVCYVAFPVDKPTRSKRKSQN